MNNEDVDSRLRIDSPMRQNDVAEVSKASEPKA